MLLGESLTHDYGLNGIAAGDDIVIDNSEHLAYQSMWRHQAGLGHPGESALFAAARPIYPQREALAPRVVRRARGSNYTGRFPGKMIMVQGLLDESSWAINAVFYRGLVEAAWGPLADEHHRIWFVEHAMHPWWPRAQEHGERPARSTRVISYNGIVQQALRDVAAWVEKGMVPPPSTVYRCVDGQVRVPPSGRARRGIQPVVRLTANGSERANVSAGESVEFRADVQVPDGAGAIVAVAWDFGGAGEFQRRESSVDGSATELTFTAQHTFEQPGVYFPALLATSQRHGDTKSPHGLAHNLGRVRVVVR